jgi:6-phosphogluconolactonase (cycloisomerase 2 family)
MIRPCGFKPASGFYDRFRVVGYSQAILLTQEGSTCQSVRILSFPRYSFLRFFSTSAAHRTAVVGSPFDSSTTAIFAAIDPSGKYVYAANGGANVISEYSVDPSTGALTQLPGSPIAAGLSPNGIAVDPSDRFVYVANPSDNNVSEYSIDLPTGVLTPVGTFATGNQPFNIAVEPLGKIVYVTNNGDNTLSAFAINAVDGSLSLVGTYATGIAPTGIVAGKVAAPAP